jgi:hypothetical protein
VAQASGLSFRASRPKPSETVRCLLDLDFDEHYPPANAIRRDAGLNGRDARSTLSELATPNQAF